MKKICIVTATRAEYGLLRCLIEDIQSSSSLELQLIVTGTHLSPEYGMTVDEITDDGFLIDDKIEIMLSSDSPVGVSKAMGLAQISFAESFERLNPDAVLVLGDRYELLPIALAAVVGRIPVIHLNGGELTEGAIDEVIRHSLTKLSALHFTAIEEYRRRVIQMGEHPQFVFNVGEVGLDNLSRINLLNKEDFESSIDSKLKTRNLIITYHPETTKSLEANITDFNELLESLKVLEDTLLIFTKSNADVGGKAINNVIDDFVESHSNAICFNSLGRVRYLSALKFVDAVIGNSSSGVVEAPTFNVATINIGDRQKGRVRAESVIDVSPLKDEIYEALQTVYSAEYVEMLRSVSNPYGQGDSSSQVVKVLEDINFDNLTVKSFFDVSFDYA